MVEFQQQQQQSSAATGASSVQSTSHNSSNNNNNNNIVNNDYYEESFQNTKNNRTRPPRTLPLPLDVVARRRQRGVVLFYNVAGGRRIRPANVIRDNAAAADAAAVTTTKLHMLTKRPNDDDSSFTKTAFPLVERMLQGQPEPEVPVDGGDDDIKYNILFLELQIGSNDDRRSGGHRQADLSSLMELQHEIQHWRQLAAQHGTFFFAFTMLEHPVSFHVRRFNSQFLVNNNNHAININNQQAPLCSPLSSNQNKWCQQPEPGQQQQQQQEREASFNITSLEEQLLRTVRANDQCNILLGRSSSKQQDDSNDLMQNNNDTSSSSSSVPLTHRDCQMAYNFMLANLDWIGTAPTTTTPATTITLSLLEHLLHVPFSLAKYPGKKRLQTRQQSSSSSSSSSLNHHALALQNLSSSTIEAIQHISALDVELYQRASQDFVLPPGVIMVQHHNMDHNYDDGSDGDLENLVVLGTNDDDEYDDDDNDDHDKDYNFFKSNSNDAIDSTTRRQQQQQQEFVAALALLL
jgi:hypothetical protein